MAKLKMHDSIKARGLRIMGTPFEERGYKMLHEVKRKPKAVRRLQIRPSLRASIQKPSTADTGSGCSA